jgi:hypothetical protein
MRGLKKYDTQVRWNGIHNPILEAVQAMQGPFYLVEDVDACFANDKRNLYIVYEITPHEEMTNIGLFDDRMKAAKFMNDVIKHLPADAVTEYGIQEICVDEVAQRYKHLII